MRFIQIITNSPGTDQRRAGAPFPTGVAIDLSHDDLLADLDGGWAQWRRRLAAERVNSEPNG